MVQLGTTNWLEPSKPPLTTELALAKLQAARNGRIIWVVIRRNLISLQSGLRPSAPVLRRDRTAVLSRLKCERRRK